MCTGQPVSTASATDAVDGHDLRLDRPAVGMHQAVGPAGRADARRGRRHDRRVLGVDREAHAQRPDDGHRPPKGRVRTVPAGHPWWVPGTP